MAFVLRTPEDLPIAGADTAPTAVPVAAPAAAPIVAPTAQPQAPPDENMQRRLDYAQWLKDNQDKAGTPDYVKMSEAYRSVSDAADAPKGNSEAFNVATRFATRSGLSPIAAADFGVALTNAGLNPLNWPADYIRGKLENAGVIAPTQFKPIPEPGAVIRQSLNVPEQASTPLQRAAEFGAEAVSGGLPAIARSVIRAAPGLAPKILAGARALATNVAAPVAGAQLGGEIGGQMYGETGRMAGSLLGGAGAQSGAGLLGRGVSSVASRYDPRQYAASDAANIQRIGENQGVPPTFGALANRKGVALERELMGQSPGIEAQSNAMLDAMQARGKALVQERQALPARTPGNAEVINQAEQARVGGGDVSGRVQQYLEDQVGQKAVLTQPVENALLALRNKMDPNDWNATVKPRLDAIQQMNPVDPATGARIPYARYEQFKNWRSNLGKDLLDMPGMQAKYHGEVYEPATQAMRDTAIRAGVPGEAFDTAQAITKSQEAAGRLSELLRTTMNAEKAPNARQFADKIDNLVANDPGELEKLGGNNVQALKELALLARRYDYASVKGGGAKIMANVPTRFGPPVIMGTIAHMLGAGPLATVLVGSAANKAFPSIEGQILESKWARNRMTAPPAGPAGPTGPNSFDRVLAAMSAANQGSR
jgi:hypothetical protein